MTKGNFVVPIDDLMKLLKEKQETEANTIGL